MCHTHNVYNTIFIQISWNFLCQAYNLFSICFSPLLPQKLAQMIIGQSGIQGWPNQSEAEIKACTSTKLWIFRMKFGLLPFFYTLEKFVLKSWFWALKPHKITNKYISFFLLQIVCNIRIAPYTKWNKATLVKHVGSWANNY